MAKEKSHIQIPKSILKAFSTFSCEITRQENGEEKPCNSNKVYCLNMDGNIFTNEISKCNVEKDYYTDFVEKNILARFETKFGNLKKISIWD